MRMQLRVARRVRVTALIGSLVLATAAAAQAQSGQDAAGAQALFEQGKALMSAGKYAEACPKLEESQRLDPGGGTLFALGLCHESAGRTATAWADFNLALSQARKDGRADREKAAQDHIHALEAILSRLTITVPEAATQLQVTRDGTVVGAAEWGTPLPVDPGAHTVQAAAPGKRPWSVDVTVAGQGTATEVTVPALEDAPTAASTAPTTPSPPPTPPPPPPVQPSGGAQRTISLIVGGAGIVGLGLGAVFGFESFSHWKDATAACPNSLCSGPAAQSTGNAAAGDAKTAADISTVGFMAGGAALAIGAVLFFTAPRPSKEVTPAAVRVVPMLAREGAGIALGGML